MFRLSACDLRRFTWCNTGHNSTEAKQRERGHGGELSPSFGDRRTWRESGPGVGKRWPCGSDPRCSCDRRQAIGSLQWAYAGGSVCRTRHGTTERVFCIFLYYISANFSQDAQGWWEQSRRRSSQSRIRGPARRKFNTGNPVLSGNTL